MKNGDWVQEENEKDKNFNEAKFMLLCGVVEGMLRDFCPHKEHVFFLTVAPLYIKESEEVSIWHETNQSLPATYAWLEECKKEMFEHMTPEHQKMIREYEAEVTEDERNN